MTHNTDSGQPASQELWRLQHQRPLRVGIQQRRRRAYRNDLAGERWMASPIQKAKARQWMLKRKARKALRA